MWTAKVFPVLAEILFRRIIFHSHLVKKRFHPNLVGLEAEVPGILTHDQSCHLLVGQGRDAMTVLAIGLPG